MEVNQTVKNFLMKLSEDEELRGKFEAVAKRQEGAECIAFLKEAGFDFTQGDLECLADLVKTCEQGELNEAQLEMISGGFLICGTALLFAMFLSATVGFMAAMNKDGREQACRYR